ncbi:MAG TPA: hypothetical protein VLL52_22515 [Anaerolineae bacterium]|nr:hypothetical protein [Anaerolineae bacterium]
MTTNQNGSDSFTIEGLASPNSWKPENSDRTFHSLEFGQLPFQVENRDGETGTLRVSLASDLNPLPSPRKVKASVRVAMRSSWNDGKQTYAPALQIYAYEIIK